MRQLTTFKRWIPFGAMLLFLMIMAAPLAAQDCTFQAWDQNENGQISRSELGNAFKEMEIFDTWSEEGLLVEEDWNLGFQEYYSGYDNEVFGDYTEWDNNQDGIIGEEEFNQHFFRLMDVNDSESVNSDEWNQFKSFLCYK